MSFLFVALGGAVGAMARYAISLIPVKTGFPILTLITNIAGAILIGFIVGFTSNKDNISANTVLFGRQVYVADLLHFPHSRLKRLTCLIISNIH